MNGDSGTVLDGSAPAQRRKETINPQRIELDPEHVWTAARCQRLLRALNSRVAVLSKEIARYASKSHVRQEPTKRPYSFPLSDTRTPDDEWVHARKKVKKTYTSRGLTKGREIRAPCSAMDTTAGPSRRALTPGEVSVPTPFLVRVRGAEQLQRLAEPSASPVRRRHCNIIQKTSRSMRVMQTFSWQPFGSLYSLKKRVDETKYTAYEGIFTGLHALIRATSREESQNKRKGARSLFSTALRMVPQYIAEEEQTLAAYEEQTKSKCSLTTRDISTEVYDDLESLGTSGKCWKHLRVVVRSHGIYIICDAIRAGLLEREFCGILLSLLVDAKAFDEADNVLSALLLSTQFRCPKTLCDALDPHLSMLITYAEHTGRSEFLYQQLSGLVEECRLPPSWLATKAFSQLWTRLIQLMSTPYHETRMLVQFFLVALPRLYSFAVEHAVGTVQTTIQEAFIEASKNTFYSLLTTITSISILNEEARRLDRFETLSCLEAENIRYYLSWCSVQSARYLQSVPSQEAVLVLLQCLFVTECSSVDQKELEYCPYTSLTKLNLSNSQIQDISSLISNIAQCCGRGASSSGFDYLQAIHIRLKSLESNVFARHDMQTIIVDSATLFAARVPDKLHHDYASSLDKKYAGRVKCLDSGSEMDSMVTERSGYRWEEGISEWVVATPAANISKHKSVHKIVAEEHGDFDPVLNRIPVFDREESPLDELQSQAGPCRKQALTMRGLMEACAIETKDSNDEYDNMSVSDSTTFSDATSESTDITASDSGNSSLGPQRVSDTAKDSREGQGQRHTRKSVTPLADTSRKVFSPSRAKRRAKASVTDKKGQAWDVFDDSDDELSFVSMPPKHDNVMRDITNKRATRPSGRTDEGKVLKRPKRGLVDLLSDSEDELCIL